MQGRQAPHGLPRALCTHCMGKAAAVADVYTTACHRFLVRCICTTFQLHVPVDPEAHARGSWTPFSVHFEPCLRALTPRSMNAQVSDLEGGVRGCHNDAEPSDLPPGAVMRGRDPLMDHLMSSKLSQELPEGFSRTTSGDMPTPGRNGACSAGQSPIGAHASALPCSLPCNTAGLLTCCLQIAERC